MNKNKRSFLYGNFRKDMPIVTFSTEKEIIFFLEGYTRKNELIVALSGERDVGDARFSF